MSTRATYEFTSPRRNIKTTIYIHHDGYPSGAAGYLRSAVLLSSGTLAERFIRANERAEISTAHEDHGDTDYRYSVDAKGIIKAEKSTYVVPKTEGGEWKRKYEEIFKGPLCKFIEEFLAEKK